MKHSEEEAKKILEQQDKEGLNLNNLTATGLRCVRNNFYGIKYWPKEFKQESPAGVVFANLLICYDVQKNICEALVGDIIWGFRQSGIPGNVTMDGFAELYKQNYIDFTDDKGILIMGSFNEKVWYKWKPKFFELLLTEPEKTTQKLNTIEGLEEIGHSKDISADDLERK